MEKELHLKVRISESDKKKIKENAEKAGLTVSQFSRKMLIDGQINVIDLEHKRTIAGIANNLNQLAKIANASKNIPSNLMSVLEELSSKI